MYSVNIMSLIKADLLKVLTGSGISLPTMVRVTGQVGLLVCYRYIGSMVGRLLVRLGRMALAWWHRSYSRVADGPSVTILTV